MSMGDLLSPGARHLLDRREFLRNSFSGLGGIALATLLAEQGALAAPAPFRPVIESSMPSAARLAQYRPKASRVLMIYCSGALSPLDVWDYKPELIKRHGE